MVGIAETATLSNLEVGTTKTNFFMKTQKLLLLTLLFFVSVCSFGQATGNTLTVLDITGSTVYWEYNFTATGGYISQSGPGAPLNVPVKIKLSNMGGTLPTFQAGDMNGNCDSYQSGSMNAAHTEFTTTLTSCCNPVAEINLTNGLRYWISIKCASSGGTPTCVTYSFSTVCEVYCVTFNMPGWASAICKNKNYAVTVTFADGSTTPIVVNFNNNMYQFCFTKPITSVTTSSFNCNCGISPERQAANEDLMQEIVVSPNPTKSTVQFQGKNLGSYHVSFYDTKGHAVIENAHLDAPVSLERQKPGIYVYVITNEEGFRQEGKIIKE